MFTKTKKSIVTFLAVIIAALLFFLGALMLAPQQTAYAYNSDNMPTGDNAIANIYDSASGKFSLGNLNALAAKAGYDDLSAMITAAESGTKKTSSDFGDTVVNFGSYTFNGITRELTWIPAYVSKDDSGNAILTLWLANTANSNGMLSNQEVSTWLDGTYSVESQIFNGSTIYSNTYDGSYIRNYVLNGSTSYTTWSSGEAITPPDKDTMTKFSQFVGSGALASYIVKPSAVGWQMNEKKMKNDVGWCCENSNDVGINYPSYWTNDNLWLPSLYEVYDIDIEDNSNATSFSEDGGLWRTGYSLDKQRRSNSTYSWLRSGFVRDAKNAYPLNSSGGLGNFNITSSYAVRPALHLNLSAVAEAAIPKAEVTVGNTTTPYSTIEQAWQAANTQPIATVKMNADATVGETLKVDMGRNITLDLNGHMLKMTGNGSVIKVNNDGNFTLNDSEDLPEGQKTPHNYYVCTDEDAKGLWVFVEDSYQPTEGQEIKTLYGGVVCGGATTYGGGVDVRAGGIFNLTDGTISGNNASYGGGVCVSGSAGSSVNIAFSMTGGRIAGNTASKSGGGVDVYGPFKMTGGSINGNTSATGGGVCVSGTWATFEVSGAPNIVGNSLMNGAESNVCLYGKKIAVTGELKNGATIGINNTGDVATGYNQSEKPSVFFKADDSEKCASANNGTVSIGAHTGGTATCVEAKTCTNCGESYGSVNSSNHNPATAWSIDTENGKHYHVCNNGCGNRVNEASHTPEADDGNCTTPIKCSICQAVTTAAPHASHDFSGNYETSNTQHWHVCTHSGCTQTDTKTNHNYHQEVANNSYLKTAATCTAKAVYYKSCVCGFAGTETFESGAPIGHDWAIEFTVDKQASCTEKGSKSKHCSRCSEKTEVTEIEMTAHSYGDWQTVTAATCSAVGSKKHICSACNHEELGTINIDPTAHSFNNWIGEVAANCTDAGTKAHKDCSLCGKHFDSDGVEITDLTIATNDNHSYGEWTVTKQSTLEEYGEQKRVCSYDDTHVQTKQLPKRIPQLVEPDKNGGEVDEVIVSQEGGLAPDVQLVVTEIKEDSYAPQYEAIAESANGVIELVYDVTLQSDGATIQPDSTLTIKLRIPENLKGKEFKLFHLHENTATDMEYTIDGHYVVVNVDELSEFIFVGEKELFKSNNGDSKTVWLVLIIIMAILILCEIAYVLLRKTGKIKFGGDR